MGFSGVGQWYRGNLHSHTTVSDGMWSPDSAVRAFREEGYHFLCLSEHDIYTDHRSRFNDARFIVLPGIEYSAILYREIGRSERYKVHHMHGILGTDAMQKKAPDGLLAHMEYVPPLKYFGCWPGAEVAQAMSDLLRGHGCLVTYNHPIWSRVEDADFASTRGMTAIEIFNYNTVQESSTGYDVTWWDTLLRRGVRLNAFASDDNHNEGLFDDVFGGWICLQASELEHDAVIEAFLAGNYYSSSGPEIYGWGIDADGFVWVDCSAVNRIVFVAGNIINDGTAILGQPFQDDLNHARYRLKGHETYVRIECQDRFGRTAWTNPMYLQWDG